MAHPRDCRGYIVCSAEPVVHYCDLGFHFDSQHKVCNWPESAKCQLQQPQTPETTKPILSTFMALDIITGEVIDPLTGYNPLNVVCRHFGAYFLPNPKQCRSYYLCAYGHMHEHSCGQGTLWNYEAQQCVLSYEANCFVLSPEEEMEIENSLNNNMHNESFVCYPVNTNYSSTTEAFHPTSSDHTRTIEPTITTPLPFSSTRSRSFTTTSTKSPNPTNSYYISCPARRQSYVAHPKDCSKYFICIMGTPVLTSCPQGLMWDSKKEYCDLGKNVKCFK